MATVVPLSAGITINEPTVEFHIPDWDECDFLPNEYYNKEIYKGNWKKDKKNGYGITILSNGKLQIGFYKDN